MFSRDELITGRDIESNGQPYASVDNFQSKLSQGKPLIINTDISSGPGIHWIVLYPQDNNLLVIDPLGPKNKRPYDQILYQIASDLGLNVKFYPGRFQFTDSSQCGWFALAVAKLLKKKFNQEPFEVVNKVFGRTADDGDIKTLVTKFGVGKGNSGSSLNKGGLVLGKIYKNS